tara:strand:- start:4849 stop:5697 length:849 start_codon:yes stop_codon:yes gene_type:complete
MAKLIINIGTEANDGTGDPIRSAMIKTNTNFTEVYGLIDDITVPTVPTDLTDLGITDGTDGQVLTTDGDGAFTFTTVASGGGDYSDADAIAAVVAADLDMAGNKVLFGNVYDAIGDLPAAGDYHGMFAHVHGTGAAYYAHSGAWQELQNAGGGSGSLPTRQSPSTTTASLANNASGNIDIVGFKSYALLSIITNKAAWVRIYTSTAARAADASRSQSTDPAPDAGVIAEVITTGAQTVLVSPGVIGYNMESTPTTAVPCAVTNLSGSTGTVFVSLNILQLEA